VKVVVPGAPWGVGNAVAIFALPTRAAGPVAEVLQTVLDALGDFGRPERAEVTTASAGEDAWTGPVDGLAAFLPGAPDVEAVHLDLAIDVPGLSQPLSDGVTLELAREDAGWAVTLFLHTNAYAARTYTAPRDNRATASVLVPRLRGFMDRLRQALGGRWLVVDATGYTDQVDEGGFRL
jgi:hypothetical protein